MTALKGRNLGGRGGDRTPGLIVANARHDGVGGFILCELQTNLFVRVERAVAGGRGWSPLVAAGKRKVLQKVLQCDGS